MAMQGRPRWSITRTAPALRGCAAITRTAPALRMLACVFVVACSADNKESAGGPSTTVNSPATAGTGGTSTTGGAPAATGTGGHSAGAQPGSSGAAGMGAGMAIGSGGAPAGGMSTGTGGTMVTQMGGSGGAAGMEPMTKPPTPHMGETCLMPGSGTYEEQGPYQVGMMDVDLGMIEDGQHTGMFTIFYPMPLETACLHPIVAWGNGTTVMGSVHVRVLQHQRRELGHGRGSLARRQHRKRQLPQEGHRLSARAKRGHEQHVLPQAQHARGRRRALAGWLRFRRDRRIPTSKPPCSSAQAASPAPRVSMLVLTGTEDIASARPTGANGPARCSWRSGTAATTSRPKPSPAISAATGGGQAPCRCNVCMPHGSAASSRMTPWHARCSRAARPTAAASARTWAGAR